MKLPAQLDGKMERNLDGWTKQYNNEDIEHILKSLLFVVYVLSMCCLCVVSVLYMCCLCVVYVLSKSGLSLVYLLSMSSLCLVYLLSVSCLCLRIFPTT